MVQLQTAARNAACDAIVDLFDGGTPTDLTGDIRFETTGGVEIVTLTDASTNPVQNPGFELAGTTTVGESALLGVPIESNAIATGVIDRALFRDRANNEVWRADVAPTGADITMADPNVTAGEPVRMTSYIVQVPAGTP